MKKELKEFNVGDLIDFKNHDRFGYIISLEKSTRKNETIGMFILVLQDYNRKTTMNHRTLYMLDTIENDIKLGSVVHYPIIKN